MKQRIHFAPVIIALMGALLMGQMIQSGLLERTPELGYGLALIGMVLFAALISRRQKQKELAAGGVKMTQSEIPSTRFCDVVAVLKDGRMVEYGTHPELIRRNSYYAELYSMQAQYYTD